MRQKSISELEEETERFDEKMENIVRRLLNDNLTPELTNLIRIGVAVQEHSFLGYDTTKEAVLEYVGKVWDAGKMRRKNYDNGHDVEGEIAYARGLGCSIIVWNKELYKKREPLKCD